MRLELIRDISHWILNPACLPIPTYHYCFIFTNYTNFVIRFNTNKNLQADLKVKPDVATNLKSAQSVTDLESVQDILTNTILQP